MQLIQLLNCKQKSGKYALYKPVPKEVEIGSVVAPNKSVSDDLNFEIRGAMAPTTQDRP
jgi:hypothetical protein